MKGSEMEEQENKPVIHFVNVVGDISVNDPLLSTNSSRLIDPLKCEGKHTSVEVKSENNYLCDSIVKLCDIGTQSNNFGSSLVTDEGEATYENAECVLKKENPDDNLCQDPLLLTEQDYINFRKRGERSSKMNLKDIENTSPMIKDVRVVLQRIDVSTFIHAVNEKEDAENNSFEEILVQSSEDDSVCPIEKRKSHENIRISRNNINMSIAKDVRIVLERVDLHPLHKQLQIPGKSSKVTLLTPLGGNKNSDGENERRCTKAISIRNAKEKRNGHLTRVGRRKDEIVGESGDGVSQVHIDNVYPPCSKNKSLSKSREESLVRESSQRKKQHNQESDLAALPEDNVNGYSEFRLSFKSNKNTPIASQVVDRSHQHSHHEDSCVLKRSHKSSGCVKRFVCTCFVYRSAAKITVERHATSTKQKHLKLFQCSHCDYGSSNKGHLKSHEMTHTAVKPFQCSYCAYSSNNKGHLNIHIRTHTGVKPFQCSHCDYRSSTKGHLKTHEMTHTGVKPFQCSFCDFRCIQKTSLNSHVLTHTAVKPFQCSYCDYRCSLKARLNRHMLSHNSVKQFQCSHCDYNSYDKVYLRQHMLSHTAVKQFECSLCDYRTRLKGSLKNHMLTHTAVKPFQCAYCDYRCSRKGVLKRHISTHTKAKPFQCSHCDYRCSLNCYLINHMLIHTGVKPFQCSNCDFKCSLKTNLRRHMLTHTTSKPFQCSRCDYRCSQKSYLNSHMLTHTISKPFQCSRCDYRCSKKSYLNRHMLIHVKPFQCSNCDYKCSFKRYLIRHMSTHTAGKPF